MCRARGPVNARLGGLYPQRVRRETKERSAPGTALIRGRPRARAGPPDVPTSIKAGRRAIGKLSEEAFIEVRGRWRLSHHEWLLSDHWTRRTTLRESAGRRGRSSVLGDTRTHARTRVRTSALVPSLLAFRRRALFVARARLAGERRARSMWGGGAATPPAPRSRARHACACMGRGSALRFMFYV